MVEPHRDGSAWDVVFITTRVLTAERLLCVQPALLANANGVAKQILACVKQLGLRMSAAVLKRLAYSMAMDKDLSSLQT